MEEEVKLFLFVIYSSYIFLYSGLENSYIFNVFLYFFMKNEWTPWLFLKKLNQSSPLFNRQILTQPLLWQVAQCLVEASLSVTIFFLHVWLQTLSQRETGCMSRYLPISHPRLHRAMPECSMRPSVLSLPSLPQDFSCSTNNLNVGDKVVAFITKVRIGKKSLIIRCSSHFIQKSD